MVFGDGNAAYLEANPMTSLLPVETALQNMTRTCAACHKEYRN
jgi:cytochrome c556